MLARVTLALCLLAVWVPAARATTVASYDPAGAISGPRLNGDRVVWGLRDQSGSGRVFAARPGAAPELLLASPTPGPPGREGVDHWLEVATSAQAVVVRDFALAVDDSKYAYYSALFDRLLAASEGTSLGPIASCATSWPDASWHTAVDGIRVASVAPCDAKAIVIRDLGGGVPERLPIEPSQGPTALPDGVALAGNMVAWLTYTKQDDSDTVAQTIFVADLSSGERRIAWSAPYPREVRGWDLRADGAVAVSSGPASSVASRLEWVDAGGIQHKLPVDVVPGRVRFVGNRIATVLGGGRTGRRQAPYSNTTLALVSTDGAVQPIARFGPSAGAYEHYSSGASLVGDLDFDGERIAWVQTRCAKSSIHVVDGASITEVAPLDPTRPCPVPHVVTRRATVSRSGVLRLRVVCRYACDEATLSVWLGGHRSALAAFAIRGAGARTLTFRLPHDAPHASSAVLHLRATMVNARWWRDARVRLRWR